MKLKRSTVIPAALLIYLAIMAAIGYPAYADGRTKPLEYFGIIAVTLLVVILLHFNIKRRDRLQREREDRLNNN